MVTNAIDRIAAKARSERKMRFTSLSHHITETLLEESLNELNHSSSPGIDGEDVKTAKGSFAKWSKPLLDAIHKQGYKPPPAKRVYIPKLGKSTLRPIAMPTIQDKTLQRATSKVLSAIYEEDFLDTSYGGRPNRNAHQALATLSQGIFRKRINWVYEADLKNFFGSLNHEWVERFLQLRVGDPRVLTLVRRWLKVGVMEEGRHIMATEGTAQGGPISVLISNLYLHYVLDLWIEKVVKPRMKGEIIYVRYLDDFVLCFQYHTDAIAFQRVISKRLAKFSLTLEPNKTQLMKFGRFAWKNRDKRLEKPKTLYFLGFTLYCGLGHKGKFKVGMKTEKTRYRRSCAHITEKLKQIRHTPLSGQRKAINRVLSGHYNYYGIADNADSIKKFYYCVIKTWRKWLGSRSQKGALNWEQYQKLLKRYPLQQPRIVVTYHDLEGMARL